MSDGKLNFHEMRLKGEVPLQANQQIFDIAPKLDKSGEFEKFIKDKIDKRLYGSANFIHPITNRHMAHIEFQWGVFKKMDLIEFMGETNTHFMRTILNKNVEFKKNKPEA